jgi:hypothetical protein
LEGALGNVEELSYILNALSATTERMSNCRLDVSIVTGGNHLPLGVAENMASVQAPTRYLTAKLQCSLA